MKTLLYSLIGVALIASIGITANIYLNEHEEDLQGTTNSPYISFVDDSIIDSFMISLYGQTGSSQLLSIQNFISQQRKFFRANTIMKILAVLKDAPFPDSDTVRKDAIMVLKPYIAPLSTDEVIQISKLIQLYDGIASGVLVNQIYDLNGSQENIGNLSSVMNGSGGSNRNLIIIPQSTKTFSQNFLITQEGKHIGFVFDQSETMNAQVLQADGTTKTRIDLLRQFFYNTKSDLWQNFSGLSFVFSGDQYKCVSCSTGIYEQSKAISSTLSNMRPQGVFDLYSLLSYLLSNPQYELSDIYILSSGIITSGKTQFSDFMELVHNFNSQSRSKIRINTVSFIVGGNETQSVRNQATIIMQGLADATGGTLFLI